MIQLERDDAGNLITPFSRALEARARVLAERAGSIDWRQSTPDALMDLRQDAASNELIAQHLRLALADGDHRHEAGQYYLACQPAERSALDSLWRRDAAAQPAPVTLFAYDSFEAAIERTLRDQFAGDRGRYGEALREAAERYPDKLQAYLRAA